MGLGNFLMKRSQMIVPGVNMRRLKEDPSFDNEWVHQPLFRDLMACIGQLGKTDLDISRIYSNGYMKKVSYGKFTLKSKEIRQLFEAMEIDMAKIDEDGYITGAVRKLISASQHARKKEPKEIADNAEHAMYTACLVLARHIFELHPEYKEQIAACAPAIKESLK